MFELVARIGFSLIVVLGLMWVLAKVFRRPLTRRGGGTSLAVLSRQQLSRAASVAIVRVADRALVVGVTDQQVSLLAETALEEITLGYGEPAQRRAPLPVSEVDGEVPAGPAPADHDALHGSVLSGHTWSQTVDFLRERTARR